MINIVLNKISIIKMLLLYMNKMKKILNLLLAGIIVMLTFSSCGGGEDNPLNKDSNNGNKEVPVKLDNITAYRYLDGFTTYTILEMGEPYLANVIYWGDLQADREVASIVRVVLQSTSSSNPRAYYFRADLMEGQQVGERIRLQPIE